MATLLIILIALVVVESLDRLVTFVAADGLGSRTDAELPRSHPYDALNPLA
ncbi:MAG: hypothetical protein GX555_10900 [Actinomycetales bacterium]|nr:hypothetical protein [Actinomycetales bacterium]